MKKAERRKRKEKEKQKETGEAICVTIMGQVLTAASGKKGFSMFGEKKEALSPQAPVKDVANSGAAKYDMNNDDPLDENLWKEVFTFLHPADYRSVLLTCRAWGAFGKDRRLRDAVLSNLSTITATTYTDGTCTTVSCTSSVPARDPGMFGFLND